MREGLDKHRDPGEGGGLGREREREYERELVRNYSFRLLKRDQYAFTAPKCLSSCVLYSASKCIFIRHCQWMLPFIYNSVICPISKKFVLAFKTKHFYSQKKIKKTFRFFFLALMTLKINSRNIFLL